jgi:hypothetical protein
MTKPSTIDDIIAITEFLPSVKNQEHRDILERVLAFQYAHLDKQTRELVDDLIAGHPADNVRHTQH